MWRRNWDIVLAFLSVSTQWRALSLATGAVYWQGLDYAAVRAGLDSAGVKVTPRLWDGIRVMERAARDALNGIRADRAMTLRTGLIITGDTAGAQKAVADLAGGMERATTAAQGLAAGERVAEAATEGLEAELRQALGAVGALEAELNQARSAAAALAGRVDVLETRLGRAAATGKAHVGSMAQQAQGARMLGQQFQDMGIMASMGITSAADVLRILSMQSGQTALALEQMGVKGVAGKVAGFLGSGLGSAIMAVTMVAAPFVLKLFEASDAAHDLADNLEKAAASADSFGSAQSMLGKIIDLNTGKLKTHNTVLIETIRLQAEAMLLSGQEDEKKARKKIEDMGGVTGGQAISIGAAGGVGQRGDSMNASRAQLTEIHKANATNAPLAGLRDAVLEGGLSATDIRQRIDTMVRAGQLANYSAGQVIDLKRQLYTLPQALNDQKAARDALSAVDGKGVSADLKPYQSGRTRHAPSTAARDESARDDADRIASITESFDGTPPAVRQADKAIRQLDDLIDDFRSKGKGAPAFQTLIESAEAAKGVVRSGLMRTLTEAFAAPETLADKAVAPLKAIDGIIADLEQRKPPNFEQAIEGWRAAKGVIADGIARPFNDFVESQQESLEILQLQVRGEYDQADALRVIHGLEKQMGPLRADQKDAVLATVQGLRAEQRELDVLRDKNRKYLDALGSVKDAVNDATQAFVRGDLGQFIKAPGKLLDAFMSLQGDKLFERIFGDLFRDLEDEVNGTSVVKDASDRMAAAVDRTSSSLGKLEAAASGAASAVAGDSSIDGVKAMLGGLKGLSSTGPGDSAEVLVKGRPDVFSRAIGGAVEKFASIFTSADNAKALGKNIGVYAGKGLEGAATGTLVAGISNSLGLKMSSSGAQLGGGVAGLLSNIGGLGFLGGPVGSIASSILGGLLGGIFTKPKYGTSFVSSATDKVSASGRGDAAIGAAGDLATGVQEGVRKIAEMLGGELGNFDTVVGMFDGKYRVRTTASGWDGNGPLDYKGKSGNNLYDFGKDEAAALSFAIMDAVKDGGVTGLSAAVQQALQSSGDLDAALKEALKVADLEQMLGGISGQIERAFKAEEKAAADRVRIARQYGFDVTEIEKINTEKRLALVKQLTEQQVGSLQRLVDEMTYGSLFAGSAVDQRAALLDAIGTAKADLDAGVEGAADTLANLYEQLNSVSEAVYASTRGNAADRSMILDQARAAIAAANERINAAQAGTSDPALSETNKALDENNDQNSKIIDGIETGNALLAQLVAADGGVIGIDLVRIAKTG